MRLALAILFVATSSLSCQGDAGIAAPRGQGADLPPFQAGPCTDPATCCSAADMECLSDPDQKSLCKCYKLWDCSQNPKKCEQVIPVPQGGSDWSCTWTPEAYRCTGKASGLPGGAGWSCKETGTDTWTCNRPTPPNPTNSPAGLTDWSCLIDDAAGKLTCTKIEPPDAEAPPADQKPAGPAVESNCADGIDNDGDQLVDCQDPDCPACAKPPAPVCPAGTECCDGKDNNGNGQIDEGGACNGVGEPCPPGAIQACDCYCGVHRKCLADGTWGPCKVDGNNTCAIAQITSHAQCGWGQYCDYGKCVFGLNLGGCKHHSDCPAGTICDLGKCIKDPYMPCP